MQFFAVISNYSKRIFFAVTKENILSESILQFCYSCVARLSVVVAVACVLFFSIQCSTNSPEKDKTAILGLAGAGNGSATNSSSTPGSDPGGQNDTSPGPNPGEENSINPPVIVSIPTAVGLLKSVSPGPDSIEYFDGQDLGYENPEGSCSASEIAQALNPGEYIKARRIRITSPSKRIVELTFDQSLASHFFTQYYTSGIFAGSLAPTRPAPNKLRFTIPANMPGVPRKPSETVSLPDNQMRYLLSEMGSDGGTLFLGDILSWKTQEELKNHHFNAKISFECGAEGHYARVKYRLDKANNGWLKGNDINTVSLSIKIHDKQSNAQLGSGGWLMGGIPDCYFLPKEDVRDVWIIEAKIRIGPSGGILNSDQFVELLNSGNFKVSMDSKFYTEQLPFGMTSLRDVFYDQDIIRE